MTPVRHLILLTICTALTAVAGDTASQQFPFTITPPTIDMGAFFSGATVTLDGTLPGGAAVIVTVSGAQKEERFGRKRKVGPIWLSGDRVRISGVPSTFLVFSSAPVRELLDPKTIRDRHLDESSFAARLLVTPCDHSTHDRVCGDYLRFKKKGGAFGFHHDSIHIDLGADSTTHFSLAFPWPKDAAPGQYVVTLYEIRGGSVARHWSTLLPAERIGFAAAFTGFATEHGSLYGIITVFIGVLVGFGIDSVMSRAFGKKRMVEREHKLSRPHAHGV